ncbi:MAG TPA: hypothetical protein V6D12_14120 [Candidatus Obscuribacterales bacterium]
MQYEKKRFTVMGGGSDFKVGGVSAEESERIQKEKEAESKKVNQDLATIRNAKAGKRVIPYGDRILVKRKVIGEKIGAGILYAPETASSRPMDIAKIIYVPDNSFADEQLIKEADSIIAALTEKSKSGDSEALKALLEFNIYLKIKCLQPGDEVMIGKYVGTDFIEGETGQTLTLVRGDEVIGKVISQ